MTALEPRARAPRKRTEFDRDAILAPLPDGDGGGEDVRYAGDHDRIREARREDRDLPQGVWQSDLKRANWDEVVGLCQSTLATKSKDLQVAAWLLEALIHRDGFAGIGPGLDVLLEMCTALWPALHPAIDHEDQPDGDAWPDFERRLAPFVWINDKLPAAIHSLPITRAGSLGGPSYCWADFKRAELFESARQKDSKLAASPPPGAIDLTAFQAAVDSTPLESLATIHHDVAAALAVLDEMDAFLAEQCGRQAPSLVRFHNALTDIERWLAPIIDYLPGSTAAADGDEDADEDGETPMADADPALAARDGGGHAGPIASREEAYRRLAEVAEFLQRTEPHSPTPYVLRRVLAWGRMPLHDLLVEMSHGRNDLAAILELLGGDRPR